MISRVESHAASIGMAASWFRALRLAAAHVRSGASTQAPLENAMEDVRRTPGGWCVALQCWSALVLAGHNPSPNSYVEAAVNLAASGRWAESLRLARLVRAQSGHKHPALAVASPAPPLVELFQQRVSAAKSMEECEKLLHIVDGSPLLRDNVESYVVRELLCRASAALATLSPRAAEHTLRRLIRIAPRASGPWFAASVSAEVCCDNRNDDLESGWRLREEPVLGCLGSFRTESVPAITDTDSLRLCRSLLVVDRSAVTHCFQAVVNESRHHDALVLTHSTLSDMLALTRSRTHGGTAARRNLSLLLSRGSCLRVIGWADEECVKLCAARRYGLDERQPAQLLVAVASELRHLDTGSPNLRVVVHTRSAALRSASHRLGLTTLPNAL